MNDASFRGWIHQHFCSNAVRPPLFTWRKIFGKIDPGCQSHQHFSCAFFIRKSFLAAFSSYVLPLVKIRTKNVRIKCWWNRRQLSSIRKAFGNQRLEILSNRRNWYRHFCVLKGSLWKYFDVMAVLDIRLRHIGNKSNRTWSYLTQWACPTLILPGCNLPQNLTK